jgi:hypothetical protein
MMAKSRKTSRASCNAGSRTIFRVVSYTTLVALVIGFSFTHVIISQHKRKGRGSRNRAEKITGSSSITTQLHSSSNITIDISDSRVLPLPLPPNTNLAVKQEEQRRSCPTDKIQQMQLAINPIKLLNGAVKRAVPRKIVHLTMFDCEEWMLELKLREMGSEVHRFVIGEAAFTNANGPRTQCFPHILASNPKIKEYESQIDYVYMEGQVTNFKHWEAEVYYKDQLSIPLKRMNLTDNDLILFTDLDEILSTPFLNALKHYDMSSTNFRLSLRWTYYGFNWVNPRTTVVNAIVSWGDLKGRCNMHTNAIRFNLCGAENTPQAQNIAGIVGWHCSWCFATPQFVHKITGSSFLEMNTMLNKQLDFLTYQRSMGLWFPSKTPEGCFASFDTAQDSFAPSSLKGTGYVAIGAEP